MCSLVLVPSYGTRTVISDFGDRAKGPLGHSLHSVAVDAAGDIVVLDRPNNSRGALFKVDPTCGIRTILSDFDDSRRGVYRRYPLSGWQLMPQAIFGVTSRSAG